MSTTITPDHLPRPNAGSENRFQWGHDGARTFQERASQMASNINALQYVSPTMARHVQTLKDVSIKSKDAVVYAAKEVGSPLVQSMIGGKFGTVVGAAVPSFKLIPQIVNQAASLAVGTAGTAMLSQVMSTPENKKRDFAITASMTLAGGLSSAFAPYAKFTEYFGNEGNAVMALGLLAGAELAKDDIVKDACSKAAAPIAAGFQKIRHPSGRQRSEEDGIELPQTAARQPRSERSERRNASSAHINPLNIAKTAGKLAVLAGAVAYSAARSLESPLGATVVKNNWTPSIEGQYVDLNYTATQQGLSNGVSPQMALTQLSDLHTAILQADGFPTLLNTTSQMIEELHQSPGYEPSVAGASLKKAAQSDGLVLPFATDGVWPPNFDMGGKSPSEPLGKGRTMQYLQGDCVTVSTLDAFDEIPDGQKLLRSSEKKNTDGSFNVRLQGAPEGQNEFHISSGSVDAAAKLWIKGDVNLQAIAAGLDAHFSQNGGKGIGNGLFGGQAGQVLAGNAAGYQEIPLGTASKSQIETILYKTIPQIGKTAAVLVDGGATYATGDWHPNEADGWHEFYIPKDDDTQLLRQGMVDIKDPWNSEQPHISQIPEFAEKAAGSSNSLHIFNFRQDPDANAPMAGGGQSGGSAGMSGSMNTPNKAG